MIAKIQEQQSLLRTYKIIIKKLEAESEAKDSEICALRNLLKEAVSWNKATEKRLNASGCPSFFYNLRIGSLGSTHFVQVLHFALQSVGSFVKAMVKQTESAKWDLDEAVKSIDPDASYAKRYHRIYGFESFVCKPIFEGFNIPNFAEMCRRVWVQHRLAFSSDEEVSIFEAKRNSRFSKVFMESVTECALCSGSGDRDGDIQVGFTVMPGFKVGRNVVQCRVHLSSVAVHTSS